MTDLRQKLEQLGLSQYLGVFVSEGFDTWETVLDIRESDLNFLNVKLGHRRKLQRAIAETRGIPFERLDHAVPYLHAALSVDGSYLSDDSASENRSLNHHKRIKPPFGNTGSTTKRKYRRRPKPDENAPERPASAYVIFSNQTRESLKGQKLNFTEIAKLVGEQWQTLSPGAREACERQAAAAKEKYYTELAEYKKTPEYTQYQEYLAEFRAKHNQKQFGKRTKVEPETTIDSRSNSRVNFDKSHRRVSRAHLSQPPPLVYNRSRSNPRPGSHRTIGRIVGSESTSPAAYSLPRVSSPRISGQYSPLSAPPTSATGFQEPEFSHQGRTIDSRGRFQDPIYATTHRFGASNSSSTPLGAVSSISSLYSTYTPSGRDLSSRRLQREPSSIPSQLHENINTTNQLSDSDGYASSFSNNSPNAPYKGSFLPFMDTQKEH